jgi:hypothetical protein
MQFEKDEFNEDEIKILEKYNLKTIEDIIRCNEISYFDKRRTLKCYEYVKPRYDVLGEEPINGNNPIILDKYYFIIKVFNDKTIKFIQSRGIKTHEDFHLLQMKPRKQKKTIDRTFLDSDSDDDLFAFDFLLKNSHLFKNL